MLPRFICNGLVTVLLLPSIALAQAPASRLIRESARRAIDQLSADQGIQATPGASRSGGKGLLFAGLGITAVGTTLSVLGATALKKEYEDCGYIYGLIYCDLYTEPNKGLVWGGIGVAAAGATMAIIGASRQSITTFVPLRGGGAVVHRRRLGR